VAFPNRENHHRSKQIAIRAGHQAIARRMTPLQVAWQWKLRSIRSAVGEGIRRAEGGPGQTAEGTGAGKRQVERLVAELSLDKQILQDIARGNF